MSGCGCDGGVLQTHNAAAVTQEHYGLTTLPHHPISNMGSLLLWCPQIWKHRFLPHSRTSPSCAVDAQESAATNRDTCSPHQWPTLFAVLTGMLLLRPSSQGCWRSCGVSQIRPSAATGASLAWQALGVAPRCLQHGLPPHRLLGHTVVQPPQPFLHGGAAAVRMGGWDPPKCHGSQPPWGPCTDLGVLQDVVDQHHPAPGIQQLLHVGVEIQRHFLVLIDAAQL